jgi:hypothetical protein
VLAVDPAARLGELGEPAHLALSAFGEERLVAREVGVEGPVRAREADRVEPEAPCLGHDAFTRCVGHAVTIARM